jgi:heme-degrading monooxygenase HmoA
MPIAKTPQPPFYAVIFTSSRSDGDHGYAAMAQRMAHLAEQQPGFLGIESAREEIGITVSYWESLEAIAAWKENLQHRMAQEQGQALWYTHYCLRVCKVERQSDFPA